jgi:hypothetical protein
MCPAGFMALDRNYSGEYCETGHTTRWIGQAKAISDFAAAITLRNQVVDGIVDATLFKFVSSLLLPHSLLFVLVYCELAIFWCKF